MENINFYLQNEIKNIKSYSQNGNKIIDDFISIVKDLTNNNRHTEARYIIAYYFGLENYMHIFAAIFSQAYRDNCLSVEMQYIRNATTNLMIKELARIFDVNIYNLL